MSEQTTHTMDVEYYCNTCGRSWSLHDATMANAELLFNLSEQHTHTTEEIRIYHESESAAHMNYCDDEDD